VPAQRHDPAAGTADVAEEQLHDRRGPDDLHTGRVLCPADGVRDGRGLFRSGRARENVGHIEKRIARNPACLLDELRRVTREVALQDLKYAARMLQRFIA
jgi:hypothetical protein